MKNSKQILSLFLCLLTVLLCVSALTACNKEIEETGTTVTAETTSERIINIENPGAETTEPADLAETTTAITETTTGKPETTTRRQEMPVTMTPNTTERRTETTVRTIETTTKRPETSTNTPETTTEKPIPASASGTSTAAYACGAPRHNCTTPEEHKLLLMYEEKGCPCCGSNSCVSFYATDEWGNNCYDMTKCPKYTEEKDPTIYCQYCGKLCGLGGNGTCVRFTIDYVCPECGASVPAKTCHSH